MSRIVLEEEPEGLALVREPQTCRKCGTKHDRILPHEGGELAFAIWCIQHKGRMPVYGNIFEDVSPEMKTAYIRQIERSVREETGNPSWTFEEAEPIYYRVSERDLRTLCEMLRKER